MTDLTEVCLKSYGILHFDGDAFVITVGCNLLDRCVEIIC